MHWYYMCLGIVCLDELLSCPVFRSSASEAKHASGDVAGALADVDEALNLDPQLHGDQRFLSLSGMQPLKVP